MSIAMESLSYGETIFITRRKTFGLKLIACIIFLVTWNLKAIEPLFRPL